MIEYHSEPTRFRPSLQTLFSLAKPVPRAHGWVYRRVQDASKFVAACWWKFRAASCYSAQVATSGFLATVSCGTWLLGHMASGSDSSSDSSSDTDSAWICNEGESTDNDEETPADQSLRGEAALVTASCPRK